MIYLVLLVGLLGISPVVRKFLFSVIDRDPAFLSILFFYPTQSIDEHRWKIAAYELIDKNLLYLLVLLGSLFIAQWMHLSSTLIYGLYLILIIIQVARWYTLYQEGMIELIEQLHQYVFIYEQHQLIGDHLFLALDSAKRELHFINYTSSTQEYREELDQLFKLSRWVVIKRISLLIDRNEKFGSQELSYLFLDINDELSQKYQQMKQLRLEKSENMMLLPMMVNLIAMVLYMMSPFLVEFIGR